MNLLPRLSQRIFNVPLAIHPRKAEVVLAALADRLGIARVERLDGGAVRPLAMDQDDGYFEREGNTVGAGYDMAGDVAVIEVSGTLVQRTGTLRPYSGMTGYDGLRQNFLMALSDQAAKGIVLDIDSPGGEVAGCFDLVDAIFQARGSKPVWAILSESAYSAAYAIASACDRIVVPRTGGVGSIGVICAHVDFSQALAAGGIKVTFINYGDRKTDGRPEIPLSDEAAQHLQADIDTMGELFVETVARNRALAPDAVRAMQAGTFMGAAGVAQGLADAVMAPDAAFRALLAELN